MFLLLCPQFVPFRDYMDRTGNHVLSMARLAKDVLAEIPDQFISYMKSRGIKPNPAPPPYTPPGHTHHHTQIWNRPLGVWLRTNCAQLPRSPAGTLCLLLFQYIREPTHQEVIVEFPASARQHLQQLVVFLFLCVNLSGIFKDTRQTVQDWRVKAFYPTLLGSDCLTSGWQQVGSPRSCCGSNLCLSVVVSLSISGHGKIDPSSLGPRCGLFPVVFSGNFPF